MLTEEQIIRDARITATDNYDKDLSIYVDLTKVDTSKPGSYEVSVYAKDSSGNRSGTATVIVKVPEAKTGKITIQYLDSENNELAECSTITGEVGAKYETFAKEIKGYTLKEKPANANGVFEENGQTVQYVYTKDAIKLGLPVYSESSSITEAPNSTALFQQTPNNAVKKQSKVYSKPNKAQISLPNTGDSTNLIFVFMGVLLIAGLTISKARRKNR